MKEGRTILWPLAVLVALGGCATTTHVQVVATNLPAALIEPVPLRVGVHYSEAFREARPGAGWLPSMQHPPEWQFEISNALESAIRQVVRKQFVEILEVNEFPSKSSKELGVDAVIVPSPPEMWIYRPSDSIYEYSIRVTSRVDLHKPNGDLLANWMAIGQVSDGAPTTTKVHQELLRNFAASLIHSFHREPALGAFRAMGVKEESRDKKLEPSAVSRRVGFVRLDAGRSHDDSLEERFSRCLEPEDWDEQAASTVDTSRIRDATFPWLEPMQLLEGRRAISRVLQLPLLRARLDSLGIGYLVLYKVGEDRQRDSSGGCVGGYGGFACISHVETKRVQSIRGQLWEVDAANLIDAFRFAASTGVGVIGALILPIPYGWAEQSRSCEEVRRQIKDAINANRAR